MAAVTIDAGARNAYYSAGNLGWSARSLFAYRTAIQQLAANNTANFGNLASLTSHAQSFTPGANMDVNEIRVPVLKVLSPVDNVTCAVYSDTGANLPNASIQAADNVYNGANISTTSSWLTFQFATPVSLTSGTKYWIVLERSGAVDATNYYRLSYTNTSAYAGGGLSSNNAGTWGAESSTNDLVFQILTETPSALYAVTQSTEPALHVYKSTDSGANWSEQDASNNPTVTDATYPFDACDTRSGPYLGTAFFTATNTLRARLFDMSTDTWGTDLGGANATTDASNERSIRIAIDNSFTTAAPGSQHVWMTSATDDADLLGCRRTTSTWSNVTSGNTLPLTSTEASLMTDVVVDKAPVGFQHRIYYNVVADLLGMRSALATTYGTGTTIASTVATTEVSHASATYQIYQVSNVDTIIAAFIDADDSIEEETLSLEVTSTSVTQGTQHAVGTATTTAGRQLSTCEYDGDGYVVVSVSGTGITYYTDAGLAGSWDGGTAWKTGLTDTPISQAASIPGIGLAVVYTENGDVKIDWIDGGPASDVTINGSLATATALGRSGSLKVILSGSRGTASALANAGDIFNTLTGSRALASALANAGSLFNDVTGSNATASAAANAGTVSIDYRASGSLATASALARTGSLTVRMPGSNATASALANTGDIFNTLTGSRALASALANVGTYKAGNTMVGNHATASALANAGVSATDIHGSLGTATAEGFAADIFIDVTGNLATASALGRAGSLKNTVTGSLGAATGTANAGDIQVDITGSLATADGEAFTGDALTGFTVLGSLATASAQAFAGTAEEGGQDNDADRRRFFQVRPLPTGT
jgi:hypothetical protein